MQLLTESRNCITCGKPLRGRADKRYCDDYCRNTYNNLLKSPTNTLIRSINNTLGKNRRILQSLLPESKETIKANRDKLLQLGFNFKYLTNTYITKTGKTYVFCYDYGYLPLGNDWFLIVRKKEE